MCPIMIEMYLTLAASLIELQLKNNVKKWHLYINPLNAGHQQLETFRSLFDAFLTANLRTYTHMQKIFYISNNLCTTTKFTFLSVIFCVCVYDISSVVVRPFPIPTGPLKTIPLTAVHLSSFGGNAVSKFQHVSYTKRT